MLGLLFTVVVIFIPLLAHGESIQKQIDAKNIQIQQLEADAAKYRSTLTDIGHQALTLTDEIKGLDRAIAGLALTIKVTNAKIRRTQLEIQELSETISDKEQTIENGRSNLSSLVSSLAEGDEESPLEIMMKNTSLSDFFTSLNQLVRIQHEVQSLLGTLRAERDELKNQKNKAEAKRRELASLSSQLADQRELEQYQRSARSRLLADTKNQEQKYRELLAETVKKRDFLQQELNTLEAGLNPNFDRSHVPAPGSGVLAWSLPAPIFITQYFGRTSFARSGAYSGKGHNGVDMRATIGTAVFSTDRGTVRATGDTDLGCARASYGRWILIDHTNGLSTLYAHLSLIKVSPGQSVNRGDLIGYSGQSGYATGPHLHLSVFAEAALTITQYRSRVCGRTMTLPIAPFNGYLNPLDYLPAL